MTFLRIGDTAPNFQCTSSQGHFDLYEYLGEDWGVFFSHPRDFTPVCTTELGKVAQLSSEWAKRSVKVVAVSVDTAKAHKEWIKDINDIMCTCVEFPLVADFDRKVSVLYGMLDQTHLDDEGMPLTVRSVFIISPNKQVKAIIAYPASTGRNFTEILRVIDSLQMTAEKKVGTPADWVRGEKTVVLPNITTDEAKEMFTKGVEEVRPWLRFTPDPSDV